MVLTFRRAEEGRQGIYYGFGNGAAWRPSARRATAGRGDPLIRRGGAKTNGVPALRRVTAKCAGGVGALPGAEGEQEEGGSGEKGREEEGEEAGRVTVDF
jgi:hypothetical protein